MHLYVNLRESPQCMSLLYDSDYEKNSSANSSPSPVSLPLPDGSTGYWNRHGFLNIGPTPRVLSLSEAVTSRPSGVASIYSNPSLLAREPRSVVDVAYTLWIANVNNQFAGVNFARERSAIAFSVYNSSSDGFEARDRPGPSAGNFSIGYISLAGAYALQLGSFSAGVSGQYLREEIFQYRASGYS